jgi:hypothetical protein
MVFVIIVGIVAVLIGLFFAWLAGVLSDEQDTPWVFGFWSIILVGLGIFALWIGSSPISRVVVYEDGSGVQIIAGETERTFPEDTFVWQCDVMGNGNCAREAE